MNSTFQALCEAVAARRGIPALAVGELLEGSTSTFAVGCLPATRFRIASVTKPFTATLALRLLDLDAPTGVWPPDVRVRHLLSHTSGFDCECGDLARFGSADDALARAVAELPSVQRFLGPDEVWSYANSGYWLAARLLEAAAGSSYEEALARIVTGPAGLEATGFDEPELAGTGPGAAVAGYPRARRASGGLVSNVDDLLRFAAWHLAEPRSASLRLAVARPTGGVYGYGLFGERVGGVEVWGHPGSYGGFQSTLLLVPARRAAFVGLTNSGEGSHALRELEDAWFERTLGARRRVPAPVHLPASTLQAFAGRYANSEATLTVAAGGEGLVVQVRSAEPVELTARPLGPTTFEIVGGSLDRSRFDFPRPRFIRFGSRLHERLA